MSEQHIPMQGTPNFRDLGGYETSSGKKIKYGRVFRSGILSELSESDLHTFSDLNISSVCDFRSDEEKGRAPSRFPQEKKVNVLGLEINPGSIRKFFETAVDEPQQVKADFSNVMETANRSFALDFGSTYRTMLDAILDLPEGEALLFHCSAGKDRTGFAAALIMMCLDVPRKTIESDYMLTSKYFIPEIELVRLGEKYGDSEFSQLEPSILWPMMEVRLEYLRAAFDAIDKEYGSTTRYLEEHYQLSETWLAQFRNKLLV